MMADCPSRALWYRKSIANPSLAFQSSIVPSFGMFKAVVAASSNISSMSAVLVSGFNRFEVSASVVRFCHFQDFWQAACLKKSRASTMNDAESTSSCRLGFTSVRLRTEFGARILAARSNTRGYCWSKFSKMTNFRRLFRALSDSKRVLLSASGRRWSELTAADIVAAQ